MTEFGKVSRHDRQPLRGSSRTPVVDKLKDFLRISEAADYLGVSPNTLRNWENAGKIAALRHPVNGYRLFKQEELDSLLKLVQPEAKKTRGAKKPR
jgi:excisionase family DNA binding protein